MKQDKLWKHLAIAFVAALCLYIAGFTWIEHRRSRLGPWEITFIKNSGTPPLLRINQAGLHIANVEIHLPENPEVTNTNTQVIFLPGKEVPFPVPFGKCLFMDPTFLPGTVTLQLFGHEIQMLPRTLTIDGEEYPWQEGMQLEVRALDPDDPLP